MDNKIQELTEKIYNEGVEKGKEEALRIVNEAKDTEKKMLAEAQKQADQILADAKKSAQELKNNTEAELKLFARQSVDALKSEITNIITGEIVSSPVKAAFADKEFIQKLILQLTEGFASKEEFTIQVKDAEALQNYAEANAKGLLSKGIKIQQVNGIKSAFVLTPADGSYKISFGEEEFVNYFKEFLRPQLVEMLF
ncbi:MAG: hypothetical protein PHX49_01375 [Bacteroidales bacterium]|jgi:V/A-type H+/Na+-transporting ATPase subunit E|nr:hypothetical protein [Bacteroidales bacterium]